MELRDFLVHFIFKIWTDSSLSRLQEENSRMLEWRDGYYNGDIKTRKTMQMGELNDDQLGLHRSQQLRELYESLSAAESNPQAKRPSAALSPEDLTDTEWYYLVCMSFDFNIDQGLPGRSLSKNQTIWLCNAHQADSKTFLRSLLAKSASIQTVVCFPHLGGVLEFGVTELVFEDRNLIQHIKTNFLDNVCPDISKIPYYTPTKATDVETIGCENLDQDLIERDFSPLEEYRDLKTCSPNSSTHGFEANQQEKDLHEAAASQAEGWRLMDDEISNCAHSSMNPTGCMSKPQASSITGIPPTNKNVTTEYLHDLHKCNQKQLEGFDSRSDDVHYENVLSTVLMRSHDLFLGPYLRKNNQESSFVRWKRERMQDPQARRHRTSQRMLKNVLLEVAGMHGDWMLDCVRENGERGRIWRPEADEMHRNDVYAERRRQGKLNERFRVLSSLVPSTGKVDKLSILDDTIDYIKELEGRIEELESCKEVVKLEARTKISHPAPERIADNYFRNKVSNNRIHLINKRRAREVGDSDPEIGGSSSDDVTVTVTVLDKNVLILIKCPWREYVLNDIMAAVSDLNLESHSVQSFSSDGNLSLAIKSQFKASKVGTPSMIRQALHRVIHKY